MVIWFNINLLVACWFIPEIYIRVLGCFADRCLFSAMTWKATGLSSDNFHTVPYNLWQYWLHQQDTLSSDALWRHGNICKESHANHWSPTCINFYHHHHLSVMELGHLLTRSGLTYPEVSSKVCHDSFCQLGNSVSLLWVIYYEIFYLHVVPSFSCIPVFCQKLVLFLIPLKFVYFFCNLSECILLIFSCI